MSFFARSAEPPFAAEGGLDAPYRIDKDPYRALDELMATVEILCPVWPHREPPASGTSMLL